MSFLEWVESASFTDYVQRNHHHSLWANTEKGYQDDNYIFDLTCVEASVAFYRRSFPNREWKRLQNVADGCRGQYKSKFVCNILTEICDLLSIDEYSCTFYASMDGKSQCDGNGKDGPQHIRRLEKVVLLDALTALKYLRF